MARKDRAPTRPVRSGGLAKDKATRQKELEAATEVTRRKWPHRTPAVTDAYREGWERTFGGK